MNSKAKRTSRGRTAQAIVEELKQSSLATITSYLYTAMEKSAGERL
jgi:hypothetical protein